MTALLEIPRRFHLQRIQDASGISGTGHVADGARFRNGWCVVVWRTAHASAAFYLSISEVEAIHGHGGQTQIVWDDCSHCGHAIEDHWMDNCGGCAVAACRCDLMTYPEGAAS